MVIINTIKTLLTKSFLLCPWRTFDMRSAAYIFWVYFQLRTHPLQVTHGLLDSKLSCFSFWAHDSGLDVLCSTDIFSPYTYEGPDMVIPIILSLYLKIWREFMPCFMTKTQHQKLMSLLMTASEVVTALGWCSHIKKYFLIWNILYHLHDHYSQMCRYQPPYLNVLNHA